MRRRIKEASLFVIPTNRTNATERSLKLLLSTQRPWLRFNYPLFENAKTKKAYDTYDSQAVSHPSTKYARCCLTCEI
ncbi:hypothetical protein L596_030954 [Steinernema carpocapsae]|uniref:Uncharacterized protein n=1 Tax=Steinernema carpocapsae TaxID=34508 RepID=A0A4U5MI27_STECR|nr:hypothetical protein L596_030954 [Steinernema carpocapsae]